MESAAFACCTCWGVGVPPDGCVVVVVVVEDVVEVAGDRVVVTVGVAEVVVWVGRGLR